MTEKDYQMFLYLSTISFEEFDRWMAGANAAQIDYAINLYKQMRNQIAEQDRCLYEEMEAAIEESLWNMNGHFDDALTVINRIKSL
jgi:outer membrane usher protein FimD/PapC